MWMALEVQVTLSGTQPGEYSVLGRLLKEQTLITDRPSRDASGWSSTSLTLGPHPWTGTLRFSGEDIRTAGLAGPYTVELTLLDPAGIVVYLGTCPTAEYRADEFGELAARIIGIRTWAADPAGQGTDDLVAWITVEVSQPGTFTLEATLSGAGRVITTADRQTPLPVGHHSIEMLLSGVAIRQSGVNGPYTVRAVLYDGEATPLGNMEGQTEAYECTRFVGARATPYRS